MQALQQLYNLRGNTCSLVNSANVTLLPKNDDDALTPVDYRPISLMHSVAKILTKVLANRLVPHLPSLVSPCQSAFVQGCFIQDSFQYIHGAINLPTTPRRLCYFSNLTQPRLLTMFVVSICSRLCSDSVLVSGGGTCCASFGRAPPQEFC
jgi:hypothetical protein